MNSLLRGSLIIFFSILLFFNVKIKGSILQPDTPAVKDKSSYSWKIFPSPTQNKLNQIIMFSRHSGIICGRFLIKYDGKLWSLFKALPPSLMTTKIFANNENNIWITYNSYSSTSRLFGFINGAWKEEKNPFANTITAVHLTDNDIDWMGGDRELAYKKNNKWIFIPYPNCTGSITFIYPVSGNKLWVGTSDFKLFYYDGKNWIQYLKNLNVKYVWFENLTKGFFLTDETLFEYDGKNITIHSSNRGFKTITKMVFLPEDEIWGIGADAQLMHYKNKWKTVPVPTFEDFLDIDMLSPGEGWITGNNGIIMHYSESGNTSDHHQTTGFNPIKIISVSKTINDEYGVAMEDLNNDGLKDIYSVCIYEPNRLYINKSEYNFAGRIKLPVFNEEAAYRKASGISEDTRNNNFLELDLGIGLADVDNDGDQDIYLCNLLGPNKFLLNNGEGFFRNVSGQNNRGTGENERTNSAVWGDVDNDGDADLFITNEYSTNRLYLNNGNGYFIDFTKESGLETTSGGMSAAFGDIDNDGDLDLCVVNWAKPNLLYKNVSSKKDGVKFLNISDKAGIHNDFYSKSNAVLFSDIDNDGDLDLYITKRKQSNRLYLNDGKGLFRDVTESFIGTDSMLSYGASFADFNQDGFQDLYVANVGDNIIYENLNGRKFSRFIDEYDVKVSGYNTGTACGDIDNDGDIDVYAANYINGTSQLLINTSNNNQYLKFKISGTISNRDAIGAKIFLYMKGVRNDLVGFREISGGSGYGSSNSKEVHFGLPSAGLYDAVIYFPASGITKELKSISSGNSYFVREETGLNSTFTLTLKLVSRIISDNEIQTEVIKLFLILTFLSISFIRGRNRYQWNNAKQIIFNGTVLLLFILQITFFFDEGFLLSSILPVSSVIVMMLILHLTYERIIMEKLHNEEKISARDRIARDLHDDLASTLSSSVIYLEVLKNSLGNNSTNEPGLFRKINWLLQQASESVTDIVWTVSPSHDKLEDLVLRLREFLSDYCKSSGIKYKTDIEIGKKDLTVNEEIKRNTYLIFKEAVNNIIKHSQATYVYFSARYSSNEFEISIEDNGIGLNETKISDEGNKIHGHGLNNMQKRAKEINADLSITSDPVKKGTKITLSLKMT